MINVFIFGSCVSRDAIELSRPNFKIVDYYARSSFYSLGAKAATYDYSFIENISSAFQKNMVRRDLSKSFFLESFPEDVDLVLVDFIDERCGLALIDDNSIATISKEFSSIIDVNLKYEKISNNNDLYYAGFENGFLKFLNHLGEKKKNIRIIRAYWAKIDSQGNTLDRLSPEAIDKQNRKLDKLYGIAEKYLDHSQFINIKPESLVIDSEHRWGPAPFHYVTDFYREVLISITDM